MQRVRLIKEARKLFNSKTKVYAYFKVNFPYAQLHKLFLFNPEYDFDKNLLLIRDKFLNSKGFIQYFTDNESYIPPEKELNHKQLSLF